MMTLYLLMGVALGIGLSAAAPAIVRLLSVEQQPELAVTALRLVALRVGFALPASVVGAAVQGLRRFDLEYGIQSVGHLLRLGLVLELVHDASSLPVLAGSMLAVDGFEHIARWLAVRWLAADFVFWPGRLSRRLLRSIGSFSIDAFLLNGALRIQYELDNLVVGLMFGLDVVPVYEAAAKLVLMSREIVDRVVESVAPSVAATLGRTGIGGLAQSLVRRTRVAVAIGALLALGMAMVGPAFLQVYVGAQLGDRLSTSHVVLWILCAGFVCRSVGSMPLAYLWGTAKMRPAALAAVAEAIVNVLLSVGLSGPLGVAGVAVGTLLPKLVTELIAIPRWAARAVGASGRAVAVGVLSVWRPTVVAAASALPFVLLLESSAARLLLGGLALVAGFACGTWLSPLRALLLPSATGPATADVVAPPPRAPSAPTPPPH